MGKRRLPLLGLLLSLALLAGCSTPQQVVPAATPAPILVQIAGSTSLQPVLADLTAAYSAKHAGVTFSLQPTGTGAGLQALRQGEADLAAAAWQPDDGAGTPEGLTWHPIARDGLMLIVHPRNSVPGLTTSKAQQLFAGWYTDWSELAGKGGEIQVLSREDGSGSRAGFEAHVMGGQRVTQTALVMPSSAAVVDWVAGHPDALGYVSSDYITTTVRALSLDGITPTLHTIEDGSYPLTRTLYLVSAAAPARTVQDFLAFCLSPAGQTIVGRRLVRAAGR